MESKKKSEGLDFKGGILDLFHSFSFKGIAAESQLCVTSILTGQTTTGLNDRTTSKESRKKYSLAEVAEHSDFTSCWLVLSDKVYDVTNFLAIHPGGEEIILENAGTDATVPFESKGHSAEGYKLMEQYCIGELVDKDRRFKNV